MKKATRRTVSNISVDEIPEGGLHVVYEDMPGLLTQVDDCTPVGSITGNVLLHRIGDDVRLTGAVAAELGLTCDRCLAHFTQRMEASFSYVLMEQGRPEKDGDACLETDAVEVDLFDGQEVRVGDFFLEQILLQFPMSQLCRQDCRGLCPGCGADLNVADCHCKERRPKTPFAALKELGTAGG